MTKGKLIGIIALAAVIVMAGTYVLLSSPGQPVAQTVEKEQYSKTEAGHDLEVAGETLTVAARALAERALGDPDAPVVIEEFASLSCSHCASFHKQTFDKLKEAYIDTGKVRFIFTDYPLNAPAVDAAIVARCLPEERYFKFIKFLFETQSDWAFGGNHTKSLMQNAKLLGATEEVLEKCTSSEKIRMGIIERMQKAAEDHEIKSTPSFLINGEKSLRGAQSFESLSKIIDELLKES